MSTRFTESVVEEAILACRQDRGYAILKQMAEALMDVGQVEQAPRHEGRTLFMIMAPK